MADTAPPILKSIDGVFVVELGEDYSHLQEQMLEELGLLTVLGDSAEPPCVALDVSTVQFIGSAFIGRLVTLSRKLTERGGGFALINASKFCLTAISMSGLNPLMPNYETVGQAVDALTSDEE